MQSRRDAAQHRAACDFWHEPNRNERCARGLRVRSRCRDYPRSPPLPPGKAQLHPADDNRSRGHLSARSTPAGPAPVAGANLGGRVRETGADLRARLQRASASLICPVTWGNIDLVHSVPIALSFAENCAVLSLLVDPRDRKRIVLRVGAKAKDDRIADRDPRRQIDVLVAPARGSNKPAAAFRKHPEAPGATASTSPAAALPKPQAMIEIAAIHERRDISPPVLFPASPPERNSVDYRSAGHRCATTANPGTALLSKVATGKRWLKSGG